MFCKNNGGEIAWYNYLIIDVFTIITYFGYMNHCIDNRYMTASINTLEMQALTKWLKQERESQQLTMRALAERMGKPHSYVQKVEQGERRLDVVEYVWYCRSLKIDPKMGLMLIDQTTTENK